MAPGVKFSVRKNDKLLQQARKNLEVAKRSYVTVGVHEDAGTYEAESGKEPVPVSKVAFWLEQGTQYMPARPFFAPALAANEEKLKGMYRVGAERILTKGYTPQRALGQIGFAAQTWIQNTIKSNVGPALSEAYLAQRRKNYPNQGSRTLIASGLLLRSVRFKLFIDGEETPSAPSAAPSEAAASAAASRAGERASARANAGAFKEKQRGQRQAARANPESARKAFEAQRRAYGPSKPKASP